MEGFAGMFRDLLAVPQTEAEKQLQLLRGLFSGMPPAEYGSFTENLESRCLAQQRVVVPALREAVEDARLNAQRRGVRDCDSPTQADLSNPAWSEFNIARDAYKRGVALVPLQDRALKAIAIQELARRGEEFRRPPIQREPERFMPVVPVPERPEQLQRRPSMPLCSRGSSPVWRRPSWSASKRSLRPSPLMTTWSLLRQFFPWFGRSAGASRTLWR